MIKTKFKGLKITSGVPVVGHLFFTDDNRYFISPTGSELFGLAGDRTDKHIVMAGWYEVDPETVKIDCSISNTLQLFKDSVESTQCAAKKHLNKQSDYGSYHRGVNNTCEAVYPWITKLESEINES